jgi:hypothetical protein
MRLILSCTGGACSRGYKRREEERERERERGPDPEVRCLSQPPPRFSYSACLCSPPVLSVLFVAPLWKALDIPFYRCKEIVQLYNGGVAMC